MSLPLPPSANSIWKSYRRRVVKSWQYCKWLQAAGIIVGKPGQVAGPLEIQIKAIAGKGWRKNRDLDNLAKPLIDLLKHTAVIEDDNSTIVKRITLWLEQPTGGEDAGVVITVQTLGV